MLLLFGYCSVFNGDDKLRKNVEEFEVAIKRTFNEGMEKIIKFIDNTINKIRRK